MIPSLLSLLLATTVSEHPISERAPLGLVVKGSELDAVTRRAFTEGLIAKIEANSLVRVEDASELSALSDDPTRSIIEALARRGAGRPEAETPALVLLVSLLPTSQAGRLLLARQVLLARDAVRALGGQEPSAAPEGRLDPYSVLSDVEEVPTAEVLDSVPDRLLAVLRPELERRRLWLPQGAILIDVQGDDFVVALEGRVVGRDLEGPILIERVAHGLRRVWVERPEHARVEAQVEVNGPSPARFSPLLVNLRAAAAEVPRAVVEVSGLTLMAAGAVFLSMAAARAVASAPPCILTSPAASCGQEESRFARVGGLPVTPLGYSLLGAGAVMGSGVWLSDERTQPWWWAAAGLALGALALGGSLWLE